MPIPFRAKALAHVQDPDQLDDALAVVGSRHWLGFGVVTLFISAALLWSMIATAPTIVTGSGVLLAPAGVAAIFAPGNGHIDTVLVNTGATINPGATIATVRNPERLDAVTAAEEEAQALNDHYIALQAEFALQNEWLAELTERMSAAYSERQQKLLAQRDAVNRRLTGERGLQEQGLVSAVTVFASEQQLAQIEYDAAQLANEVAQLVVQRDKQLAQRQHELAELRIRVQGLFRRAETLRREYERQRLIIAEVGGVVAEVAVDSGDPVTPGQTIARILRADSEAEAQRLTAVAYLPASHGKNVETGMDVRISPATVKFELDGYVKGRVVRIAELPASREGLMRRLRNSVLVDDILRAGAAFEVEVELIRDPSTPSGFAWTSGRGPEISLEAGTPAQVEVVTGRTHIISLLFPAVEYLYGWLRAAS